MEKAYLLNHPRQQVALCIMLSVVSLLLLAGCSRQSQQPDPAPQIQAQLRTDPSPARMGDAQLEITITSRDGEPIEGAGVSVRGDMTHAGMVPVFGSAEEIGDGLYTVPFAWTMGGDWVVTVIIELPDGTVTERALPIQVDAVDG